MRIRALLLSTLLIAVPAQAQPTGVWGERGLATMPDARVGQEREVEIGTRLISLGNLPTALLGYGRFTLMNTDAILMYGIPGHAWPMLSLKHQLQRPTRENPTGVAIGLGMLGVPANAGIPGSNLFVTLTRDINTRRNGQDWTLFSAHLGFRTDLSLQSRLMGGLELPLGQHGSATAEWIGAQGSESGYTNFGLNLSPLPSLSLSLFSLGLPNASLFDRGLAIGASFTGVLPAWSGKTASAPTPAPTPLPTPAPSAKPSTENPASKTPSVKAPSVKALPSAPVSPPPPPKLPLPVAEVPSAKAPLAPIPIPSVPSVPSVPQESAPKPPAMPTGTLIGRAVDASGKAIADAKVMLTAPGAAERHARTTPSGYFTFAGLANGSYTVSLTDAEGRAIATQTVTVAGAPIELTLKPQAMARLKGQVLDAQTGSALGGAAVAIGKERGETDRDGYFDLKGLPAAPWTVSVSAKGYAATSTKVTGGSPRIALSPLPGSVSGRILTTTGKPVAGAIAQIGSLRAPSDAKGNYLLSNVPAGTQTLTVIQDGKTLLTESLRLPPGGKAVKDAKVREAAPVGRFGMIGGQVRNAAGEALRGVKIVVEGKAVTILTVTDETGRFSVLDLLPGEYRLKLEKGTFADQEAKAQVQAGTLASVDVTMRSR
ncbi:Cna protein B-type domain protein [compost metagenome]